MKFGNTRLQSKEWYIKKSMVAIMRVVDWLELGSNEISCEVDELIYKDRKFDNHAGDNGDIHVYYNGSVGEIEVKWLDGHKWSVGDWPHACFAIDAISTYDAKQIKPMYYVMLNKQMTSIARVCVGTSKHQWREKKLFSPFDARMEPFYVLPKKEMGSHVEFRKIDQWSEGRYFKSLQHHSGGIEINERGIGDGDLAKCIRVIDQVLREQRGRGGRN